MRMATCYLGRYHQQQLCFLGNVAGLVDRAFLLSKITVLSYSAASFPTYSTPSTQTCPVPICQYKVTVFILPVLIRWLRCRGNVCGKLNARTSFKGSESPTLSDRWRFPLCPLGIFAFTNVSVHVQCKTHHNIQHIILYFNPNLRTCNKTQLIVPSEFIPNRPNTDADDSESDLNSNSEDNSEWCYRIKYGMVSMITKQNLTSNV